MTPSGIIGVVHLRALPGDPHHHGESFDEVLSAALRDVEALLEGGVAQMIVENFGSTPFQRGTPDDPLPPHVHAFMTRVVSEAAALGADVGVNCLRNDGVGAVGVAAAAGGSFVRINVLSGAYVTDQGLIESDAARVLRYRAALAAEVAILADVLVKHAQPLGALTLDDAIDDVVHRGGADGVIITGRGTGQTTDLDQVKHARSRCTAPLFVGSGVTLDNIAKFRPLVDGVIVGTSLKVDGEVRQPVDAERVRALVGEWGA